MLTTFLRITLLTWRECFPCSCQPYSIINFLPQPQNTVHFLCDFFPHHSSPFVPSLLRHMWYVCMRIQTPSPTSWFYDTSAFMFVVLLGMYFYSVDGKPVLSQQEAAPYSNYTWWLPFHFPFSFSWNCIFWNPVNSPLHNSMYSTISFPSNLFSIIFFILLDSWLIYSCIIYSTTLYFCPLFWLPFSSRFPGFIWDQGTQLPLILITPTDIYVSFVAKSPATQKTQGLMAIIYTLYFQQEFRITFFKKKE